MPGRAWLTGSRWLRQICPASSQRGAMQFEERTTFRGSTDKSTGHVTGPVRGPGKHPAEQGQTQVSRGDLSLHGWRRNKIKTLQQQIFQSSGDPDEVYPEESKWEKPGMVTELVSEKYIRSSESVFSLSDSVSGVTVGDEEIQAVDRELSGGEIASKPQRASRWKDEAFF